MNNILEKLKEFKNFYDRNKGQKLDEEQLAILEEVFKKLPDTNVKEFVEKIFKESTKEEILTLFMMCLIISMSDKEGL